ncbi:ScbA/BarX family gamma-butyrolactone biosynthesis protein [Streptomyces cinerochromogenes]|uniref:ScbA/BarX family gamma-butyrolactone biosynthesis protein n=1 Tax=Streptomyces cinerochromogenes TaxID=66422 RepID=A0ABW7BB96_9ACTN
MTLSEITPELRKPEERETLGFHRTVDRRMVHRASVAEVFVTGMEQTGALTFRSAAQLPLSHGYFNDHTAIPATHDPLLLLEICRQASIYGAHAQLDVPLDTTFMVNDWAIDLRDSAALVIGDKPGELLLSETMTPTYDRRNRITALRFDIGMELAGETVGTAHIRVSSAPTAQYAALRFMQRGSTPPMTSAFRSPGGAVRTTGLPARVGRVNPANVVLADAGFDTERGSLSAVLAPDFGNSGLFDHDYDHIPAMVLMEAARQSALLLASARNPSDGFQRTVSLSALEASFSRFAELDSPVRITAAPDSRTGAPNRVAVTFEQSGTTVAAISTEVRPSATTS